MCRRVKLGDKTGSLLQGFMSKVNAKRHIAEKALVKFCTVDFKPARHLVKIIQIGQQYIDTANIQQLHQLRQIVYLYVGFMFMLR